MTKICASMVSHCSLCCIISTIKRQWLFILHRNRVRRKITCTAKLNICIWVTLSLSYLDSAAPAAFHIHKRPCRPFHIRHNVKANQFQNCHLQTNGTLPFSDGSITAVAPHTGLLFQCVFSISIKITIYHTSIFALLSFYV